MSKDSPFLKAVFSTANFNGVGATIMSAAPGIGSPQGFALYTIAVVAGTYNKYLGLKDGGAVKRNAFVNWVTDPSVTAKVFVAAATYGFLNAAGYNLYDIGKNVIFNNDYSIFEAQRNIDQLRGLKLPDYLVMGGWVAGGLGDNALRRLDKTNFKKNAQELGASAKSRLSKGFNALVSNPTVFYGLTSTFFVLSELTRHPEKLFQPLPAPMERALEAVSPYNASVVEDLVRMTFSTPQGFLGVALPALVGYGIYHACRNTHKAIKNDIPEDQMNKYINDGRVNWLAFAAKTGYAGLAFATGQIWLGWAHLMFAGSSLKVIPETLSALDKKKEPVRPGPSVS